MSDLTFVSPLKTEVKLQSVKERLDDIKSTLSSTFDKKIWPDYASVAVLSLHVLLDT